MLTCRRRRKRLSGWRSARSSFGSQRSAARGEVAVVSGLIEMRRTTNAFEPCFLVPSSSPPASPIAASSVTRRTARELGIVKWRCSGFDAANVVCLISIHFRLLIVSSCEMFSGLAQVTSSDGDAGKANQLAAQTARNQPKRGWQGRCWLAESVTIHSSSAANAANTARGEIKTSQCCRSRLIHSNLPRLGCRCCSSPLFARLMIHENEFASSSVRSLAFASSPSPPPAT